MLHGYTFVLGAKSKESLPKLNVSEVAFAGRSNVGKSSLINALTNNKRNARISSTPGSTRQINFYLKKEVMALVDLPGYGYTKASKEEMYDYLDLIRYYLKSREALQRLVLLIDSRVGIKEIDLDFLEWVEECGVSYNIVLTKVDKLSDSKLGEAVSLIQYQVKNFHLLIAPVMAISTKSGKGIRELAHEVSRCV